MKLSFRAINGTAVGLCLAAGLFFVALVDGGSIALAHLSAGDRVLDSGQAAATAAKGLPPTQHSATVAFEAAQHAARRDGLTVQQSDFTVYPDGRVTLTVSRKAPTLLLHRLPMLRDHAVVSVTETVEALPYS